MFDQGYYSACITVNYHTDTYFHVTHSQQITGMGRPHHRYSWLLASISWTCSEILAISYSSCFKQLLLWAHTAETAVTMTTVRAAKILSFFSFSGLLPIHTDALNGLVIIMHVLWFAILQKYSQDLTNLAICCIFTILWRKAVCSIFYSNKQKMSLQCCTKRNM